MIDESIKLLEFDWDKGNIDKNWNKHAVGNDECEQALYDDFAAITVDWKHLDREVRFMLLGETKWGRALQLIFTIRHNKIRVISARDQNLKERFYYYEQKKIKNNS